MHDSTIMIIDDHPMVRSGYRQLIESETGFSVCGEAGSIHEALRLIANCRPTLAIVDLALPDGNGLELIRRILVKYPDILVLVCSMYAEELFSDRALRAGAKGYINKQEAGEQVMTAIRQILDGKIYLSEQMNKRLLDEFDKNSPTPPVSDITPLTNRELEVYQLIGQGLGTSEIAEKLFISIKTVESHRANIKEKLGLLTGSELIRSAMRWSLYPQ